MCCGGMTRRGKVFTEPEGHLKGQRKCERGNHVVASHEGKKCLGEKKRKTNKILVLKG